VTAGKSRPEIVSGSDITPSVTLCKDSLVLITNPSLLLSYHPPSSLLTPAPSSPFSLLIPLKMRNILVVGASRGLGHALVQYYAGKPSTTVYGTSRKDPPRQGSSSTNIKWLSNIDLTKPSAGPDLASQVKDTTFSTVFITAGIFKLETFDDPGPDWEAEVATYTTSAIAPPFILSALYKANCLQRGAKVVLISSEAGSFALQQAGGGGNYAHHASKSALNMVGLQLKYDLEPKGIAIAMVHPSFMRTEMTKGVGFDVAWEENEALTPDEAARLVGDWTEDEFDMSKTGQFWAPRGTRDIGSWKEVMGGEHIKGPVQLPF
jgi:NAD(P)-dependent dehydrogenase (short-subunit alcohol dehydrogenase family)